MVEDHLAAEDNSIKDNAIMKKLLIIGAISISALLSSAQSVTDGLLFGQQDEMGTARYRGLSGAFGAIGGDLTAIGSNPAGSTVFANHYFSFSAASTNNNNNTSFNNTSSQNTESDFTINQIGAVFVYQNENPEARVNKFSFGVNYDSTRDYDNSFILQGTNSTSIGDYFVEFANGERLIDLQLADNETISGVFRFFGENGGFGPQQAFLGYQSFVIDPVDPNDDNNVSYVSNTGTGSFNQRQFVSESGNQGKFVINGAIEVDSKLSLGVNLNLHSINLNRFTQFDETNSNDDATVQAVNFNNDLQIDGGGVSLQAGLIFKATKSLRLGASYQSPTWYRMEESLLQSISTRRADGSGGTITEEIFPDVITIFQPYNVRTPGNITGSAAYIFGGKGLISIDYQSTDYSQLRFSPQNDILFAANNQFIEENLSRAATLRIGGEYRIERFSLRAGYRMEESPYEDNTVMGDLNGYSLGLGYNWGKTSLDLSYNRAERDFSRQLFNTGLTSSGMINNVQNNVVATLGFNF